MLVPRRPRTTYSASSRMRALKYSVSGLSRPTFVYGVAERTKYGKSRSYPHADASADRTQPAR